MCGRMHSLYILFFFFSATAEADISQHNANACYVLPFLSSCDVVKGVYEFQTFNRCFHNSSFIIEDCRYDFNLNQLQQNGYHKTKSSYYSDSYQDDVATVLP